MSGILFDLSVIGCIYLSFGVALFSRYRLAEFGEIDRIYIGRRGRLAPAWFWWLAVALTVLSWPKMFWGR